MSHLAVMAVGRDRPGIVQAISEVLLDHRLNIEDSQMTILGGHFATMLIVSGADGPHEAGLSADLLRAGERVGLEQVSVRAVAEVARAARAEPSHVVTVYGSDHPGIVHAVAAALGDRDVNITDLQTRLIEGEEDEPMYVMMLEVRLPDRMRIDALEQALAAVGTEQGVDVTIRQLEREEL